MNKQVLRILEIYIYIYIYLYYIYTHTHYKHTDKHTLRERESDVLIEVWL